MIIGVILLIIGIGFVLLAVIFDSLNHEARIRRLERREHTRSLLEITAVNTLKHQEGEKDSAGKLR